MVPLLKKWLVCLVLLATSPLGATSLVIGAEDDWAPYCERDKDNEDDQPHGLAPELVKAVFAAEGVDEPNAPGDLKRAVRDCIKAHVSAPRSGA